MLSGADGHYRAPVLAPMVLCWLKHLCLGHGRPLEHQLHCLLERVCHQQNQAQRLLVAQTECDIQLCCLTAALILVLMAVVVLAMILAAMALALIAVLLLRTLILLLRSALLLAVMLVYSGLDPWSLRREASRRSESARLSSSEPALWR